MKHVSNLLIFFLVFQTSSSLPFDIFGKNSNITSTTPKSTYATKTHLHQITRKPPKPQCHPFNIFCVPCKIGVNMARTAMDHVVFIHKGVESLCSNILGRHKVCDSIIKLTMFYLDHTPTDRICKRFFLCGNKGIWDWWLDANHSKNCFNLSSQHLTVLQILNTPSNNTSEQFYNVKNNVASFIENNLEVSISELPENIDHQIADFIFSAIKAAELLDNQEE
ncbi:unnamed protein product [Caenorhabditis angaria]|uniref:Saposin B-type domain-containing protein n=1 Tax=Caenorhabditis angaria TaxID=860376 RepID=A0A9P1N9P8_9PELO|nr:unnamed protein product [Caenorhabditis angaria]